jgi:hypothetical protein
MSFVPKKKKKKKLHGKWIAATHFNHIVYKL